MKAVIMAGGKGTRLATMYSDIPKPMAPIAGKPILQHQIETLKQYGISEFLLVIGHLGAIIRDYFADGSKLGVNINYYEEKEPLGSGGALPLIMGQIEEDDFILIFGDVFFDIDFARFIAFHKDKHALISILAHPNSHPFDSDLLELGTDDSVRCWIKKGSLSGTDYHNLVNAGLYIISKEAITTVNESGKIDFEKGILQPLISTQRVFAYRTTEFVKDIGTPERILETEKIYQAGIPQQRSLANRQKCIFLDRDGTINVQDGFVVRPEMLILLPTAAEAIRKINQSEYLCILITNQPIVARGDCTIAELETIHKRLETLLGDQGAYLDDIYYCPHHPDKGFEGEVPELKIECECRKPKPGMLLDAAQKHNIDLSQSWMIGDTGRDLKAGNNAGCRTALVRSTLTGEAEKLGPVYVADDLLNLIENILGNC